MRKSKLLVLIAAIACFLGVMSSVSFADGVVFYDESGTVTDKISNNENIYAEINVTSPITCNDASIVAGHYNVDGVLIKAEYIGTAAVTQGEAATCKTNLFTGAVGAATTKVFVWESMVTMRPLLKNYGVINKQNIDIVFENTEDYLYRVGNANEISLGSLFKAVEGEIVNSENVKVEVTEIDGATAVELKDNKPDTSDWTKGIIQFKDTYTGPVKVTISDGSDYLSTTLYIEVVDAKNITSAESATSNNVVLLNDVSGTFSVSGGYTFFGNGFTVTLPDTYQSKYSAGYVGYVNLSGGNLDNVKIVGPVYPEMYIYRDQAKDSTDTTKVNYFYNSVIVNSGNCTISNSYISGSRTALCLRGGNNVVIENTTLSGGSYANMQIAGASSVTLRDLTTVQTDVADSYGKGKTAHGLGIAVDSNVVDLYIEGELNQYNWLCEEQWNNIVPSNYQSSFPDFFGNDKFSSYWHYLNGGTDPYVNMTFIYACNWDVSKIHDNRASVDYAAVDATISGVDGGVYSKVNTAGNAITDVDLADPGYAATGFDPIVPVLNFDNTPNNDDDDANDEYDTYCVYDESSGILKIGMDGSSKNIDLSKITITKNGKVLSFIKYLNGTEITEDTVTIDVNNGTKQTLTFKTTTNDCGYDKYGNPIAGSIDYTWTVTVEAATLVYPAPVWNMGGDYTFDISNCYYAYYQISQGYGEAVPIYEGIKINYYNKSGTLVNLDLSGTTTLPTGSNNANANAFTYTLSDGSTLTMKFVSGWKSGATTHQFTVYNSKAYIYPQSLDNDNYVRSGTTNQDFNVKLSYTFTDPNGQSTETVTMNWYNAAASNGSVSTVQWKDFDSTNGKEPSICISGDTLVMLADGTQKRMDEVTYDDNLLVWDFYKGEYTVAKALEIFNHGFAYNTVITLRFSDGTVTKVVNEHGYFDVDINKFVAINGENAKDYIGHKFVRAEKDGYTSVELVDCIVEEEYIEAYSVFSAYHYNFITDGILSLTSTVYGLDYFMPFEVGYGMKFDEEKMNADIEKYGLYTYEDLEDVMTPEQFDDLNASIIKVSVGKGIISYDAFISMMK